MSENVGPAGIRDVLRRGNLPVLLLVAVLLGSGLAVHTLVGSHREWLDVDGIRVRYPAGWLLREPAARADPLAARSFEVIDLVAAATFKPRLAVHVEHLPPSVAPGEATTYAAMNRPRGLTLYHELGETPVKVGQRPGSRVDYVFVIAPPASELPGSTDIPVVVRASEVVAQRRDKLVRVVAMWPESRQATDGPRMQEILSTLEVAP